MMGQLFAFVPDRFRPGLALLLTAYDYAQDSQTDPWQYAVGFAELQFAGTTLLDIRWLVHRGFAEHALETTIPGDQARMFRALPPTSFPPEVCLALSADGAAAIRSVLAKTGTLPLTSPSESATSPLRTGGLTMGVSTGPLDSAPRPGSATTTSSPSRKSAHGRTVSTLIRPSASTLPSHLKPVWDRAHRELHYNDQLVKRYRVPAANQIAILEAFQEDGWPEFIDDPIPPAEGQDPKQRLNVTIKSLNRNQVNKLIRFHGNGDGVQVYWEAVEPD